MLRIVINDFIGDELEDYLSIQEGILSAKKSFEGEELGLNIEYDNNITPEMIYSFISIFKKYTYPHLWKFNKGLQGKLKTYTYYVEDMCCENCYMGFIENLFKNENINSVTSDFDDSKRIVDANFTIEYKEDYKEEDLIKYIKAALK